METLALNANTMLDIYKLGKYYNPASTHYGEGKSVICDRCAKRNLNACIGYLDYDLCLSCADVVDRKVNKSILQEQFRTPMQQGLRGATIADRGQVMSYMQQDQFSSRPLRGSTMYDDYTQIQSDMQQDQFNSLPQSSSRDATSNDYSQVMSFMEQDQFDR